jgi:hypothetical protein
MTEKASPVPGSNRRVFPRYPLSVAGTAWSLTRVPVGPFQVRASNISLAGIMLHSSVNAMLSLREGDELLLGFPEPDSRRQIEFKARIVWKRHGLAVLLGSWSFGAVFHDTPETEIRKLLDPASAAHAPIEEGGLEEGGRSKRGDVVEEGGRS